MIVENPDGIASCVYCQASNQYSASLNMRKYQLNLHELQLVTLYNRLAHRDASHISMALPPSRSLLHR
jgi:hypothetical protein